MEKIIWVFVLILFGAWHDAVAAPGDMTVSVWDAGCNHTMTTNHFVLQGQETTLPIELDFSACSPGAYEDILVFGYTTKPTSSRYLVPKDNVSITLVCRDQSGEIETEITDFTILASVSIPSQGCTITATNNNKGKKYRIRLRSQLVTQVDG